MKYFFKHWIPGFGYSPSIYNLVALAQMLVPFISLVLFSRIRNKNKYVITLLWCSFLIMNVIQLLVIHFESRYFIPVRILSIGWLINLFALYRAERREVSTANSIIKQKVNFRGNFHR
jgi:phosphate starvation-inducible membrane PsiE